MNATPGWTILVFLFAVALLLAALRLLWTGIRPRRHGDEPHCRGCGYLLLGIDSQKCPECGLELTGNNIVLGVPERRPARVWGGVSLLLLAVLLASPFALSFGNSIRWYQWAPTFWVIRDLQSASPTAASDAMRELTRRGNADELSISQRRKIADIGLQAQATTATGGVTSDLVEFTSGEFVAGRLTDQQKATFEKQSIRLSLRVRPIVRLGDVVPYQVTHTARVQGRPLWTTSDVKRIEIDGKVIQEFPGDTGGTGSSGTGGLGASVSTVTNVKCDAPGEHELAVTSRAVLSDGSFGDAKSKAPLFKQDIRLAAKFRVLGAGESDGFQIIDDSALATVIQQSIVPEHFEWQGGDALGGQMKMTSVPANVAFGVYVRIAGREDILLSQIYANKGSGTQYGVSGRVPGLVVGKPATIDLVLRTNEKAARESVDQFDVWKGELVYPNVPVGVRAGQ